MFHSEVVATLGVDNSSSWNALADELVETYEETITLLLDKLAPNRSRVILCSSVERVVQ